MIGVYNDELRITKSAELLGLFRVYWSVSLSLSGRVSVEECIGT